jgi:hypothetical protein
LAKFYNKESDNKDRETVVVFGGANWTDADGVNKVDEKCNVTHISNKNDLIPTLSTKAGFKETGIRVNILDSDPANFFVDIYDAVRFNFSSASDRIDHSLPEYERGIADANKKENFFYTSNPNKALSLEEKFEASLNNLAKYFTPPPLALQQTKQPKTKGPAHK